MTGETTPETEETPDLKTREMVVLTPVIVVILALGFFPKPLLDVIDPAVDRTLTQVNQTDPVPEHPLPSSLNAAAEESK